ncbi:MAG: hypothetical protein IAI50_09730 [Candidatus Eremiobacteraeota bacterium]|nr:hypothetical protein [Candidatus Eremiobacteraeota bacterium]
MKRMRISISNLGAACAAILSGVLAGCAGGTSQPPALAGSSNALGQSVAQQIRGGASQPVANRGFMNAVDAKTSLVYLSDFATSLVSVFTKAGLQVGQIANGLAAPEGMFVDAQSNLWVANTGVSSDVVVFSRGGLSPTKTLHDPVGAPIDVTVCKDGTAYVADLYDNSNNNAASVQVFAPGSTKPTGNLNPPADFRNTSLTCDAKGNVFVALLASDSIGSGRIVEFPSGKQSGVKDIGVTLQDPSGMKPDNAGNLLVNDLVSQTIAEYTEAGKATGISIQDGTDIFNIALSRDGETLLGAAASAQEGKSWSFPAGKPETTYTCCSRISQPPFDPEGIAIDPSQANV